MDEDKIKMPNIYVDSEFWFSTVLNKRQIIKIKKYDIITSK